MLFGTRVIEQMPTLIGASFGDDADEEQVGLYHSSAFFNLYGKEGDSSWGSKAVERQKLARYPRYPRLRSALLTICSPA